jgi:hypothetical protein
VEFALIASVLVAIILVMIHVGGAVFQYIELLQALSGGSEYAMNHASDPGTGVLDAVNAALPSELKVTDKNFEQRYFCMSSPYTCSTSTDIIKTLDIKPIANCGSSGQVIYLKASPYSSFIRTTLNACEIARFQ